MRLNFSSWFRNIREAQYPAPLLAAVLFVLVVIAAYVLKPPERLTTQELVAKIVASGRLSRCAQVHGAIIDGIDYETVCRNNVSYQLALKTLDVSYCEKLDDIMVPREACAGSVLLRKVVQERNLSVCEAAGVAETVRRRCEIVYWTKRAIRENDIAICAGDSVPSGGKTACEWDFWNEAILANPVNISCNGLPKLLENDCANFKRAVVDKNADFCGVIADGRLRGACVGRVSSGG